MRRREFIGAAGGAAVWPLMARAQQPLKSLHVGAVSGQPRSVPFWVAFNQRMIELGYQEGKNFTFEYVFAPDEEGFERGYRTLVDRKVDIIVAGGPEISLKSAIAATRTLPIVMVALDFDPLTLGYVANLARPVGNVTGIFSEQTELLAKQIQLIKEAFPNGASAIVFWDALSADQWSIAQSAAHGLGLQLIGVEFRDPPYEYSRGLATAPTMDHNVLFVLNSSFFFRDRERLANLALRNRMPSMFVFRQYVEAGGLLSYGSSITTLYKRVADYVDLIAKGAKPSDLPIEQPTKFEMVVNLKTAKAIDVTLPTSILLRADEVIE
jgi:putative tryptophan/tyrosine transport system substrate-binding protein